MSEEKQIAKPVDYQKLMMDAAKKQAEAERPDNQFISFKSGVLSYNETPAPGNKIKCVVIGACFENGFYPYKYDPKKVRSPDCWALGFEEKELVPGIELMGKEVELTDGQSDSCEGCALNEWGSDLEGGKGKACKNTRRLAVAFAPDLGLKSEVLYARLPVTSVKNWAKYVNQIAAVVKRPTWAVLTEISVVPDLKSQFQVKFEYAGELPYSELEGAHALYQQLVEEKKMLFGYQPNGEDEEQAPAPAPAGKKPKF